MSVKFDNLFKALARQKEFSDMFINSDALSDRDKEEITKTFVLSLHSEVGELGSAINFKDHRSQVHPVDINKILYKSVDIFRYTLALLNLWEIDASKFVEACDDKDLFLHMRHEQSIHSRGNRPVVIFDVDDVIAEFRITFNTWLNEKYGVNTDPNSPEYYNTVGLVKAGIEPEGVFREFISAGGFKTIPANKEIVKSMQELRDSGYWIHLLTARPSDNLKCFYDSYSWLNEMNIPFDAIDFSGEKFRWLADQDFFNSGDLVCAIDDSSKHAAEYAKHGVEVIVPDKSYNKEVHSMKGVTVLDFETIKSSDLCNAISKIKERL